MLRLCLFPAQSATLFFFVRNLERRAFLVKEFTMPIMSVSAVFLHFALYWTLRPSFAGLVVLLKPAKVGFPVQYKGVNEIN